MTRKLTNPLFDTVKRELVMASDPVEAAAVVLSPISKKPMKKVMCSGIESYYDEENRLVLPIQRS